MKWLRAFAETSKKINILVLTTLMYILAIGITSLIAKTVGKRFLLYNPDHGTWEPFPQHNNPATMF